LPKALAMIDLALHHVSIPTLNLETSARFYEDILRLKRIPRPPFSTPGIWYGIGRNHIHITVYEHGSFRPSRRVDNDDIHFALRTDDFDGMVQWLNSKGYNEALPDDHPQKMILKRSGAAGFPQLFIMDPDCHTIEINSAAFWNA
jgi:glyoxylase I family protein